MTEMETRTTFRTTLEYVDGTEAEMVQLAGRAEVPPDGLTGLPGTRGAGSRGQVARYDPDAGVWAIAFLFESGTYLHWEDAVTSVTWKGREAREDEVAEYIDDLMRTHIGDEYDPQEAKAWAVMER